MESFGLLGVESAVYQGYPWTHPIAATIEQSRDPFFKVFQTLVRNWNLYLFQAELPEIKSLLGKMQQEYKQRWAYYFYLAHWSHIAPLSNWLILAEEQAFLAQETEELISYVNVLLVQWDEELFAETYERALAFGNPDLERSLEFANKLKPSSGLQFTLADVGVALALTDQQGFFTASPVRIHISERGYLEPFPDSSSNVFYYNRVDHARFAKVLIEKLTDHQE